MRRPDSGLRRAGAQLLTADLYQARRHAGQGGAECCNYSDAHCFPVAYTDLGIGETVGMPVPGTCTSVWWETLQDKSLYFGIPQVGYIDNEGDILENKHLAPDHLIDNDPALEATGRDQQLEKAVEVLLSQLDSD